TDGTCISDSRMLVNYYRNTLDGRLVFGRGGGKLAFGGQIGTTFDGPSPRATTVTDSMRTLYPSLRDVPVTHHRMGPIHRTQRGRAQGGRGGPRRPRRTADPAARESGAVRSRAAEEGAGHERVKDVVIVGGGIAGLTAAWQLRDLDAIVLEADERVGGRIKSF